MFLGIKVKPKELAAAGFFHSNRPGDSVTCYVCSAGLKDWDDGDDPWHFHARFFGECEFVRLMKGKEFIKNAREKIRTRDHQDVSASTSASMTTGSDEKISIDNKFLCVICFENQIEAVFLPCKHVHTCMKCAVNLTQCCSCRVKISKIDRIFLP